MENNMKNTIGARIAELRKEKNMTQSQLAMALNVSDKAVSKWESAGACPDIDLLPALSDLFQVSIDYIVRGECPKEQKIFSGIPRAKINMINGYYMMEGLNKFYLSRGWHVAIVNQVATENAPSEVIVVIERDR